MSEISAERIARQVSELGLADDRQVQEAWAHFGRNNISADELIQFFLGRNILTNWQSERLQKGETHGYFCGPYKLLYLVGTGTFSRVYRAQKRGTTEVLAVKILRRRHSENPGYVDQFLKEGKMGKLLRHPCIVPVFDVGQDHHTYFIAMEFVEGQNLREFIKIRKKLDPAEATRIMMGVCSGLQYAAERGISHRDLKLSNVLISSTGQPKLVDFGLAGQEGKAGEKKDKKDKESKDGEESHSTRTVDYVGLARACGTKPDDPRNDIFFAGAMYYHMMSGASPLFETRDRQERLQKSRYTDVMPILRVDPAIPKSLAGVVSRAMDITPNLRYQTPAEMLAELQLSYKRLVDAGAAPEGGHDVQSMLTLWGETQHLQKTLMLVESNVGMQDVLKNGLKKIGYRVLMTRDPDRAVMRFSEKDPPDCAIFSTLELGMSAVEAFNRMGSNDVTRDIAAVLLLNEQHNSWESQAILSPKRVVLRSPIKMRDFRTALNQLVPNSAAVAPTASQTAADARK